MASYGTVTLPSWTHPPEDATSEITKLNTAREWLDAYITCANDLKTDYPTPTSKQLVEQMTEVVQEAIAVKTNQLRNSATRSTAINTASRAGMIPFGKVIATSSAVSIYSGQVLKAFGLGNSAEATELYLKANSKGGNPTTPLEALKKINKKLGKRYQKEVLKNSWFENRDDIQQELTESLSTEVGEEVADHIVEELVHVIPFAGQLWSAGRGAYKCGNKLEKALVYLSKAALDYHMTVLLPLALQD